MDLYPMQSACICYNRVSIFSTEQENKTRWKNIEVRNPFGTDVLRNKLFLITLKLHSLSNNLINQ